ncbi:MAG TPA: M48 family metalloprotease [Dehalococcoidia bacterium]|nr:M48 family metalloprotease [Dehalococcoidia bacterium]
MAATIECAACGRANRAGARFCTGCGAAIEGAVLVGRPVTPPMPAHERPTVPLEQPAHLPATTAAPAPPQERPTVPLEQPPQNASHAVSPPGDTLAGAVLLAGQGVVPSAAVPGFDAALRPAAVQTAAAMSTVATPAAPASAAVAGAALPGPLSRETFYAAQRRYRRRALLLSLVCAVPVLALAILVAALISPWLYLAAAVALRLLRLAGPLSGPARDLALLIDGLGLPLKEGLHSRPVQTGAVLRSAIGLLAPSIALIVLLWLWVRVLFRHAATGGTLLRLGAREPKPNDLEERQLVNVVEEIAIAAGIPSPRVLVLDGRGVNAAVIGSSHTDATVVVSRAMLDTLSRDELLGVLAVLAGSAGNGDLGLANTIVSVFQTIGLVLAGRDFLFSGVARRTVWRFLGFVFHNHGSQEQKAARAAALSELMLRSATVDGLDDDPNAPAGQSKSKDLGWLGIITVWPYLASAMFRMFMLFYENGVTGPLLGWIWRTRRYLADATSVQLTRNPDGLAHALVRFESCYTAVPGGGSASHLFVVGQHGSAVPPAAALQLRDAWRAKAEQLKGKPLPERLAAMRAMQAELAQRVQAAQAADPALAAASAQSKAGRGEDTFKDELGMHGLQPPIDKRLRKLQALGAHVDAPSKLHSLRHASLKARALVFGLIGLFGVVIVGLLGVAVGLIVVMAAAFNALLALPVLAIALALVEAALR